MPHPVRRSHRPPIHGRAVSRRMRTFLTGRTRRRREGRPHDSPQGDDDPMPVVILIVALASFVAQAASTAGVHVWTAADMAAKGKTLAQKLDANKVASEVVSTEGNRMFMIAHR